MNALIEVKKHLEPGVVYRRTDLLKWSKAVDRHLVQLQKDQSLKKLSGGLYYCPKKTSFGDAPPSEYALVESFLKDSRFLIFTPNSYNSLDVGTTQLYNETIVYNHKRHGLFPIGNRTYRFIRKHHFPKKLSDEFLLVDLLNNILKLAEDMAQVLKLVVSKVKQMDIIKLQKAVVEYGGVRARKFFAPLIENNILDYDH